MNSFDNCKTGQHGIQFLIKKEDSTTFERRVRGMSKRVVTELALGLKTNSSHFIFYSYFLVLGIEYTSALPLSHRSSPSNF